MSEVFRGVIWFLTVLKNRLKLVMPTNLSVCCGSASCEKPEERLVAVDLYMERTTLRLRVLHRSTLKLLILICAREYPENLFQVINI